MARELCIAGYLSLAAWAATPCNTFGAVHAVGTVETVTAAAAAASVRPATPAQPTAFRMGAMTIAGLAACRLLRRRPMFQY